MFLVGSSAKIIFKLKVLRILIALVQGQNYTNPIDVRSNPTSALNLSHKIELTSLTQTQEYIDTIYDIRLKLILFLIYR